MKKVLSIVMSVLMVFSITAGVDLSAYADDSYLPFGSVQTGQISWDGHKCYKFSIDSYTKLSIDFDCKYDTYGPIAPKIIIINQSDYNDWKIGKDVAKKYYAEAKTSNYFDYWCDAVVSLNPGNYCFVIDNSQGWGFYDTDYQLCVMEEVIVPHSYKRYVTKATLDQNGSIVTKCSDCGDLQSKSTIYYPKTIALSATSYVYNGSAKKPAVKVLDAKGNTISAKNYTVTYPSGRKNIGRYVVKVTFSGYYSGTKNLYFTIIPKAVGISKISAAKKGFKIAFNKQPAQITGYQLQYSTNKKFKNAKTVNVSKKHSSKTIKKLKSKKKYYVRVRAYKTVNNKNYYSSWSKTKTVKTK